MSQTSKHKMIATFALLTLVSVTGIALLFSGPQEPTEQAAAPDLLPPAQIQTLSRQTIQVWQDFSGYIDAVDRVAIRPRVSGAIQEVLFEEGGRVQAGDPLFVIDPRPFQTELASARAQKASAQSRVELATQELGRLEGLLQKRAVSKSLFDAAKNELKVAQASLQAADARIAKAELDIEYAHIKAPVSGLISRAEMTLGNLVEAGPGAPVLATIVANDRVYAEFDIDEQSFINAAQIMQNRDVPVELTIGASRPLTFHGKLHAFDNQLDRSSGTLRARAVFDNSQGILLPGMFAKVRLGSPEREQMLLIPEDAVATDQARKYVYVIDDQDQIAYREVSLGRFFNGRREILKGLEAGDRLLVNGLQRVRPGMKVQPVQEIAHQKS